MKTGNDATDKVMRKTLLKYLFLLFLQVLFPVALHSQFRPGAFDNLTDSETVRALKGHVGTIASTMMEGRAAGSEGERLAAEYVTGVFRSYGIDVLSGEDGDLFGIRQEGGDTLRSRNVCAFIEGTDKSLSDRYIVIGARMDNLGTGTLTVDGETVERIRYGANGNASGLAMLLEVGRLLKTNNMMLRRSVLLVAFGASRKGMVGSWYFLNRSFSDVANIDAMINLDMLGTGPESFYAYTCSNADMNAILESLSGGLHPILPKLTSSEPYPSDHRAFYDKGIPSVFFTSGEYPEHDTDRRFCEGDSHYGGLLKASRDCLFETLHLMREESHADCPQCLFPGVLILHDIDRSDGCCRMELQGETAVLRTSEWPAAGDG